MTAVATPTMRRRRLGMALRQLREMAGFTCREVGDHQGCDDSRISRIEQGTRGVRTGEVRELLDLYGVTDAERRDALVALARHAGRRGWWVGYSDVMMEDFASYVDLESDATTMRRYANQHVPGLLQTSDYARSLSEAGPATASADDIERRVALRLERQQTVLTRDVPPVLCVVLDESVLRNRVGTPDVMRDQLEHLIAMAARSNVTIQVLPFASDARTWTQGAFTVLEYPELVGLDVIYLEHWTGGLFIEDKDQIDRYRNSFDYLQVEALTSAQSVECITRIAEDTWPPSSN